MKRILSIILVIICIILPLSAFAGMPNATTNFYVNDFAGVFTQTQVNSMMERAVSLADNYDGVQVVVTTVKSLDGKSVENYAYEMYNAYGIGKNSMGVLILMSTGDRKIRMEIGDNMEAYIPDSLAGRLLDSYATPYLKNNQFDKGLVELQKIVIATIAEKVPKSNPVLPAKAAERSLPETKAEETTPVTETKPVEKAEEAEPANASKEVTAPAEAQKTNSSAQAEAPKKENTAPVSASSVNTATKNDDSTEKFILYAVCVALLLVVTGLLKRNRNVKSQCEEEISTYKDYAERFEAQFEDERSRRERLQHDLNKMRDKVDEKERELSSIENSLKRATSKIKKLTNECSEAREIIEMQGDIIIEAIDMLQYADSEEPGFYGRYNDNTTSMADEQCKKIAEDFDHRCEATPISAHSVNTFKVLIRERESFHNGILQYISFNLDGAYDESCVLEEKRKADEFEHRCKEVPISASSVSDFRELMEEYNSFQPGIKRRITFDLDGAYDECCRLEEERQKELKRQRAQQFNSEIESLANGRNYDAMEKKLREFNALDSFSKGFINGTYISQMQSSVSAHKAEEERRRREEEERRRREEEERRRREEERRRREEEERRRRRREEEEEEERRRRNSFSSSSFGGFGGGGFGGFGGSSHGGGASGSF